MKYTGQLERIARLPLRGMSSGRFDCFGCGGGNTLSVNVANGETAWYCFRASCDIRGRVDKARSATELRAAYRQAEGSTKPFTLPPHFTNAGSSLEAIEWMRKNHVLPAWQMGRCEVRYDPRQRRVVFLVRQEGDVVDAVGRSLDKAAKPKWLRYGASDRPLSIGQGRECAVVVEDAASAAAVSGIATGVAILGTHLTAAAIAFLREFKSCIVALDPDATGKSLSFQQVLSRHIPTRVVRLTDDLKYFDEERIRQELRMS